MNLNKNKIKTNIINSLILDKRSLFKSNDLIPIKHYPPTNKEWFNSIYQYNKNYIKSLPITDIVVNKLFKSYFYLTSSFEKYKINARNMRIRNKRMSANRIYLSKPEIKHSNNKVIITLYTYNRTSFCNGLTISRKKIWIKKNISIMKKFFSFGTINLAKNFIISRIIASIINPFDRLVKKKLKKNEKKKNVNTNNNKNKYYLFNNKKKDTDKKIYTFNRSKKIKTKIKKKELYIIKLFKDIIWIKNFSNNLSKLSKNYTVFTILKNLTTTKNFYKFKFINSNKSNNNIYYKIIKYYITNYKYNIFKIKTYTLNFKNKLKRQIIYKNKSRFSNYKNKLKSLNYFKNKLKFSNYKNKLNSYITYKDTKFSPYYINFINKYLRYIYLSQLKLNKKYFKNKSKISFVTKALNYNNKFYKYINKKNFIYTIDNYFRKFKLNFYYKKNLYYIDFTNNLNFNNLSTKLNKNYIKGNLKQNYILNKIKFNKFKILLNKFNNYAKFKIIKLNINKFKYTFKIIKLKLIKYKIIKSNIKKYNSIFEVINVKNPIILSYYLKLLFKRRKFTTYTKNIQSIWKILLLKTNYKKLIRKIKIIDNYKLTNSFNYARNMISKNTPIHLNNLKSIFSTHNLVQKSVLSSLFIYPPLSINTTNYTNNLLNENEKKHKLICQSNNMLKKRLNNIFPLYLYNLQMANIHYYKYKDWFLISLNNIMYNIYHKKIEFNFINIKYIHLSSDMLSESMAIKLKSRKNRILKILSKVLKLVKMPSLHYFLSTVHESNKEIELHLTKYKTLIQFNSVKKQTNVMDNINFKKISGIRLEAAGRLTKRLTASRSIFKMKHKGTLKNIQSSYKGISSVIVKGYMKSNIQYSNVNSKTRNGSFGLKTWISCS